MRRAVITGLGIVSSIGVNKEDVLASLKAGKSGITFSEHDNHCCLRMINQLIISISDNKLTVKDFNILEPPPTAASIPETQIDYNTILNKIEELIKLKC